MPHYSVATTKDRLSSLIDRALKGEEVVITRHGKPVAELRMIPPAPAGDRAAAMDRLRDFRATRAPLAAALPLDRFYEWLYEDAQD